MAAQRDQVPGPALPQEAPGARLKSLDRLFGVILGISFVVHSGFYVALARTTPPAEVTLEEIPDRYAKVIVPERLPRPPEPRPEEKAPEPAAPPPRPEQAPEKGADEKRGEAPEQVARRKAARAAAVAKAVQSKGLLKVLGALGPGAAGGAVADVFGSGARMADVASALSGAGGVAVATDPHAGARKGGGEARAASIGQLATAGAGKVALGAKTEVRVTGTVAAEAADVDSSEVDQGRLGAFVRARMGLIKACYESALKRNPALAGRISIRFTILETGALADVVTAQSSLASAEVASCITTTMRGWRTPFRPTGPVTVEYPFVFQPVN